MGFLSVGVVHCRRGVELAGGEEFLFIDPLVCVVWDLTVPGPRRDDRDAGPSMQESAVCRARDPIVNLLLAGQMIVGPCHRPDERLVFQGLGWRALFDKLQRRVEVWGSPRLGPIKMVGVRLGYPRNESSAWRSISSLSRSSTATTNLAALVTGLTPL